MVVLAIVLVARHLYIHDAESFEGGSIKPARLFNHTDVVHMRHRLTLLNYIHSHEDILCIGLVDFAVYLDFWIIRDNSHHIQEVVNGQLQVDWSSSSLVNGTAKFAPLICNQQKLSVQDELIIDWSLPASLTYEICPPAASDCTTKSVPIMTLAEAKCAFFYSRLLREGKWPCSIAIERREQVPRIRQ